MVPQAAVFIGVGVLAFIVGVAWLSWEQEQNRQREQQQRQQQFNQYRQESLARQPPAPRKEALGLCGICGGQVYNESYQLPCTHHLHLTCAVNITKASQGHPTALNWPEICRNCVNSRANEDASTSTQTNNEGLRKRRSHRQICADCEKKFVDNDETHNLACKHKVHKTCWDAMERSGFTTCPKCAEGA